MMPSGMGDALGSLIALLMVLGAIGILAIVIGVPYGIYSLVAWIKGGGMCF